MIQHYKTLCENGVLLVFGSHVRLLYFLEVHLIVLYSQFGILQYQKLYLVLLLQSLHINLLCLPEKTTYLVEIRLQPIPNFSGKQFEYVTLADEPILVVVVQQETN